MKDDIEEYGWTAMPRDFKALLQGKPYLNEPTSTLVDDIAWPTDDLVTKVQKYAKEELQEQTYNHSMRAYYFGNSIRKAPFAAQSQPCSLLQAYPKAVTSIYIYSSVKGQR